MAGSALGSFARGFVNEGAFALGLDALIDGLYRTYEQTVGPLPPLPRAADRH